MASCEPSIAGHIVRASSIDSDMLTDCASPVLTAILSLASSTSSTRSVAVRRASFSLAISAASSSGDRRDMEMLGKALSTVNNCRNLSACQNATGRTYVAMGCRCEQEKQGRCTLDGCKVAVVFKEGEKDASTHHLVCNLRALRYTEACLFQPGTCLLSGRFSSLFAPRDQPEEQSLITGGTYRERERALSEQASGWACRPVQR